MLKRKLKERSTEIITRKDLLNPTLDPEIFNSTCKQGNLEGGGCPLEQVRTQVASKAGITVKMHKGNSAGIEDVQYDMQ